MIIAFILIISFSALTAFLLVAVSKQSQDLKAHQDLNFKLCVEIGDLKRERNFYRAKAHAHAETLRAFERTPDDVDDEYVEHFSGVIH